MADLPGLIEGASNGEGLGDKFLKHIERTKIIAHIIDMSGIENDPYEAYLTINNELKEYSEKLMSKPRIIIANKMDISESKDNLIEFKKKVDLPIFEISAINEVGLDEVMIELANMLDKVEVEPIYKEDEYLSHVLYKFKEEKPFTITYENNAWVIKGEKIERLFKMTKFSSNDAVLRFTKTLRTMGIDEKLKEMGAQDGDTVRIQNYEFTYID